jgi:hypothetical protein
MRLDIGTDVSPNLSQGNRRECQARALLRIARPTPMSANYDAHQRLDQTAIRHNKGEASGRPDPTLMAAMALRTKPRTSPNANLSQCVPLAQ